MPKWCAGAVVVTGLMVAGGCAVEREPLVLIEPDFSYVRDGERLFEAARAEFLPAPLELADVPTYEVGLPVELTEPSLLRPARTLVQSEGPPPQP